MGTSHRWDEKTEQSCIEQAGMNSLNMLQVDRERASDHQASVHPGDPSFQDFQLDSPIMTSYLYKKQTNHTIPL